MLAPSNVRKVKKLFQNPKWFIADSRLGKAVKKKAVQFEIERINKKYFSFDEACSFKKELSEHVETFFIPSLPGQREAIVIVESNISKFISVLIHINQNAYEVAFDNKGKLIKKITNETLSDLFINNRVVNFRFVSRRTKEQMYFEIQLWREEKEFYDSPNANMVSRRLWKSTEEEYSLLKLGKVSHYHEILGDNSELFCGFDVDYVFTWVNSDDEDWKKMYNEFNPVKKTDANSISRFLSRDELMFSLRAIEEYAPWVRKIHVVSNCKPPKWLDVNNVKINWVDHSEIFDEDCLPTFSSHSIEATIHKIKELSNHFIYSNDDFILSRPVSKNDFFEPNGNCKIKFEKWGNVNGIVKKGDPDYLNAARNCQLLLEKEFGVKPSQLHCHAPQAMRVDILSEMEGKYSISFDKTRKNKFRDVSDIAVTGFLFHHYAYLSGRGVKDYTPTMLIQRNHNYIERFEKILNQKNKTIFSNNGRYLSFCVNDGADSHLDEKWNVNLNKFLDDYLSNKSQFELSC